MHTFDDPNEQKQFLKHWYTCPPRHCLIYIDYLMGEALAPCGRDIGSIVHGVVAADNGLIYNVVGREPAEDDDEWVQACYIEVDKYSIRPLEVLRAKFYRKRKGGRG